MFRKTGTKNWINVDGQHTLLGALNDSASRLPIPKGAGALKRHGGESPKHVHRQKSRRQETRCRHNNLPESAQICQWIEVEQKAVKRQRELSPEARVSEQAPPPRHAPAYRHWTTAEVRAVVTWAKTPDFERPPIEAIAEQLNRTVDAVRERVRRSLPREEWPWRQKPRWTQREAELAQGGGQPQGRSEAAVRKHRCRAAQSQCCPDHQGLSVAQVARDLGRSETTVRRLVRRGYMRRFKGGIAESSFEKFLRTFPGLVPYAKLTHSQREWLVLNGFQDRTLQVKRPSVRGLLE